ncbi:hypothetical protein EM6_1769 [Asticcacaulis excentricus]|uniref:Uncharacterized protein n=1 Tax=Asticcacaulis excentricus TaxID=78587 RepID=A0A3G9G7L2_9CAUL|nr:hypothetical protein EM6_1769 [Asticcacaulis excentricus]
MQLFGCGGCGFTHAVLMRFQASFFKAKHRILPTWCRTIQTPTLILFDCC